MQVKLEKRFPLNADVGAAWRQLSDIRSVAECMPGAEITEQVDERNYKGQIKVKVGPASMQFKGDIEVMNIDAGGRAIRLVGKGADTKGTSSATMDLTVTIAESAGKTELVGISEVSVTGKMASLGGRMLTQVSDQLVKQFAERFNGQLAAQAAEPATAVGGEAGADNSGETPPEPTSQSRELNGLALAWSVIVGLIKDLFGRGSRQAN